MQITTTTIPYQRLLLIGFFVIAGLGVAAIVTWIAYLCVLALVLGLQLLVDTFSQLTTLISGTPVLHFLFVLGLLCLITVIIKWMITKTYRFVVGVQHGL